MNRAKLVDYLIENEFDEDTLNSILRKFELESVERGAGGQHNIELRFRKTLASNKNKLKNEFYKKVITHIEDTIYAKRQELKEQKRKDDRNERRRNR